MVKNNKLFFLFFALILTILASPSAFASDFYISENNEPTSMFFSANSNIGIFLEGYYHMDKATATALLIAGKRPENVRIYLKNPLGETIYCLDMKGGRYGFTDTDFIIELKDVNLRVPAFPQKGTWTVEIIWWSQFFTLENRFATFRTSFLVGESSFMENMMAPIYFYWDVFGIVASGDEISFALPGLFFLSMIIWIPLVFIILIKYWKSSYIIGRHLLKGGKKDVKKTG